MLLAHISSAPFLLTSLYDARGTYKACETFLSHVYGLPTTRMGYLYAFTGSIMFSAQVATVERTFTQFTSGVRASVVHSTQCSVK